MKALAGILITATVGIAGCGHSAAATGHAAPQPAKVVLVPGTGVHRITLTSLAVTRLGIQTTQATRGSIPFAAVIYDPQGETWTYENIAPQTYIRVAITVSRIDGYIAVLSSGPLAGTPIVTVGAPELLGTEYGVGEE